MKKIILPLLFIAGILSCSKDEECIGFSSLTRIDGSYFVTLDTGEKIEITEKGYERAKREQDRSDSENCYDSNWITAKY